MIKPVKNIPNPIELDDLKVQRKIIRQSRYSFWLDLVTSLFIVLMIVLLFSFLKSAHFDVFMESAWYFKAYLMLAGIALAILTGLKYVDLSKMIKARKIVKPLYVLRHDLASYIVFLNEFIDRVNTDCKKTDANDLREKTLELLNLNIAEAENALTIVFSDKAQWDGSMKKTSEKLTTCCLIGRSFNLETFKLNFPD